jgi:D-glycero-alpha-D-manno-heptose-7-phosphate kinase
MGDRYARAPMRIGLAGGGTDIAPFYQDYGGCSLTVTIKKYAYASFNGNPDNSLFASAIKKHLGHKGEISTRKDAENLSGLGGSAAFAVAVIGLLAMGRMSKQAVAEMAMDLERNKLGVAGGVQDFFASSIGGFNYFEYNSDGVNILPMLRTSFVDKLENSLLLFFTTKRDLDGSGVQDDVIMRMNEGQNIEALLNIKENCNESRRAIRKERLHEFGELLDNAWMEKKKLSKFISNEKLDELYESCRNNGAIAGKLMGAGGGGYMLLLCSDVNRCANYLSSRNFSPERVLFDWDGLVVGDL